MNVGSKGLKVKRDKDLKQFRTLGCSQGILKPERIDSNRILERRIWRQFLRHQLLQREPRSVGVVVASGTGADIDIEVACHHPWISLKLNQIGFDELSMWLGFAWTRVIKVTQKIIPKIKHSRVPRISAQKHWMTADTYIQCMQLWSVQLLPLWSSSERDTVGIKNHSGTARKLRRYLQIL